MIEINFKRTEYEDRALMDSYFAKSPSRSCERTFANVYLWSRHYPTRWALMENALVFKTEDEESLSFAYPAGDAADMKKAILAMEQYSLERGYPFSMYNVTPEQFEQLESWYPGEFQIEYDRDEADYIYEREKLVTLSGKKLHSKRNHINKFKNTYDNWSYEALTPDNLEECFQMALKWRNLNGCDDDHGKNCELCVTLNALRLFEELHLEGGFLRVDGEIVAFTIGEPVSEDTFVVHIEKAFSYVDGAYTMINQQFAEHTCEGYLYINREDDAGEEGLRKAKLSYRPAFLVEKGIVTRKES